MTLAGCASAAPDRDIFGNVYPAQCNPTVLAELHPTVIETAESEVILWKDGRGAGNYGGWVRPGVIAIRGGLDPATKADIIRHEKTHECMYRLTGSPQWH